MSAWSDPVDLSPINGADSVRLTDLGNSGTYLLTYVSAGVHYAIKISISQGAAVPLGPPVTIYSATPGTVISYRDAPEYIPAINISFTDAGKVLYSLVDEDAVDTFCRVFLIDPTTTSIVSEDVITLAGTGYSSAIAYLGDAVHIFAMAGATGIDYATFNIQNTFVAFVHAAELVAWNSNLSIPIQLVKNGYRSALLFASQETDPVGYTLADSETFAVDCSLDEVIQGLLDPTVTQYSAIGALLRSLPGTYPIWNGYEAIGVMDATTTPYEGTPFVASLDAQTCSLGPVGVTHPLPTWADMSNFSPRLSRNLFDYQVDAVALIFNPDAGVNYWVLITDVMIAPLQVFFPEGDDRFGGLNWTSTTVDKISVVKADAYYLVAMSYMNGLVPVLKVVTYKDDAAMYGYVQDNQLRVIQRPLPSPGQLYPITNIPASSVTGSTSATIPDIPQNLLVTSTSYQDTLGRTWARTTFHWDRVVSNTDGSTLTDFSHYLVYFRTGDPGSSYIFAGTTMTEALDVESMEPGTFYAYTVYCVSQTGAISYPAPELFFYTEGDGTPPNTPSTPTLTSTLGTIRINWDGLDDVGGGMPSDFAYAEVHGSLTSGFAPGTATLVARVPAPGYTIYTPSNTVSPYYFKLVAFDTSGNESPPSAQSYIVVSKISGPDLEANSITANQISAGAIDGQIITGAIVQTAKPLSLGGQNARIMLDSTQLVAYNSSGVATFTLDAATGALVMDGSLTSGGSITGYSIYGGSIRIGSATTANVFKADTSGIWLGAQTFASAPFSVTIAGALHATTGTFSGDITGASGIFSGSIQIGSGSTVFKADSNGIYLGSSTFATAPFRVTPGGILTASNANITGNITANTIAIGGVNGINYNGFGTVTIGSNVTITGSLTAASVSIDTDNFWSTSSGFKAGSAGGYFYTTGGDMYFTGSLNMGSGGTITSGTISGGAIVGGTIGIGAATTSYSHGFIVDSSGNVVAKNLIVQAGGDITSTGAITCSSLVISGSVTAGSYINANVVGTLLVSSTATVTGNFYPQSMPSIGSANGTLTRLHTSFGYLGVDSSSRRYKENILDADIDWLGTISSMRVVTFTRVGDETNTTNLGYIAEDLWDIEAMRYVVPRDKDGIPSSISYDYLSVYAIEAIKQQQNTIAALTQRVAVLEGTAQ